MVVSGLGVARTHTLKTKAISGIAGICEIFDPLSDEDIATYEEHTMKITKHTTCY